jgi:DNA-directed RNA polymerase subunit RPC12/RpoP
MAYPTCPGCRVPQLVDDDAVEYRCVTCYSEVRFHTCPHCGLPQSILRPWTSYTCARCERRADVPPRIPFPETTRATRSEGAAWPYPKL